MGGQVRHNEICAERKLDQSSSVYYSILRLVIESQIALLKETEVCGVLLKVSLNIFTVSQCYIGRIEFDCMKV